MNKSVIFDRLSGCMIEYVENYLLNKSQSKIIPSYKVDYEISQEILFEIEKSLQGDIDTIWYHKISECVDINDLPTYLQKLVIQCLPLFFERFPQYKGCDSLQLK